ncbi:MAG: SDR family NAD(P)-dependent oxidoreductase, partial [Alphaproteobacteria bacterium]|nr:SDR family NAD(P)-dependent oxidoreductase [Alphaproteobacteria bacterium]
MKKIAKNRIQTWFVTGASSGIGKELCLQLLNRGYNVVAISRRELDYTHDNILWYQCDVSDENSVKNAIDKGIKKFGRIDVLVNNAGISSYGTIEEETIEKMKQVMDVNFWGSYNTIHLI